MFEFELLCVMPGRVHEVDLADNVALTCLEHNLGMVTTTRDVVRYPTNFKARGKWVEIYPFMGVAA